MEYHCQQKKQNVSRFAEQISPLLVLRRFTYLRDTDLTGDIDSFKMTYLDQILGVCIELVGTTLSICGLNGQKHSLMRAQNNEDVNNLNVGWIVSFSIYAVG